MEPITADERKAVINGRIDVAKLIGRGALAAMIFGLVVVGYSLYLSAQTQNELLRATIFGMKVEAGGLGATVLGAGVLLMLVASRTAKIKLEVTTRLDPPPNPETSSGGSGGGGGGGGSYQRVEDLKLHKAKP